MASEQSCRRAFDPCLGLAKLSSVLLLFPVILWTSGCATISDRSQYILFDSKPRGLEIGPTQEPQDAIGVTPLVQRVAPQRSFETHIFIGEGRTRKIGTNCSFAWGDLLLGNLAFAAALGPAVGGVYFGVAVATDMLSESAYACPERVGFDAHAWVPAEKLRASQKDCRVIVAAPPYHFQSSVAEAIYSQWAAKAKAQLSPCDRILDLDVTRSDLAALNITFDKPTVLRNLTRMDMNQIGLETGATHFADLDIVEAGSQVVIKTKLYDIRSSDSQDLGTITVPALRDWTFYRGPVQVLDQSFYLLPNTLEFSSLFAFPDFAQDDKSYKFNTEDEDKDFLSVLANWEMTYVPRPSAYPSGTFRFLSAPSLWSQLMQRKMNMYWRYSNVDPDDGVYVINERMNLLYLGLTQEARLYLMFGEFGSPLIGGGAGLVSVSGRLKDESSSYFGPYAQAYAGYLVETGPSVFLELQGGYGLTPESHFSTRFSESSSLAFVRVKAGFYLFELRETLRSWL